jgi:hypothetical protein
MVTKLSERNWFSRHPVWSVILVLVFFSILMGSLFGGEKATENDVKETGTTSKPPSELILELSDFVGNYTIIERTPRLKSDVNEDAINWGWKEGYYIRYARIGENIFDSTVVEHFISIYPSENISKLIAEPKESDENWTYEEMPNPTIGDTSRAYRITITDEYGGSERAYQIEFIKNNVYELIIMSGPITDYESLKELAKKAGTKT